METVDASAPIKCAADKFYNFFKFNMSDVVKIFPAAFTGVELLEGEEGTVGCVKLWNYVLGGIPMTVKVKTEVIDDGAKSIKWVATEGDVLQLYNNFAGVLRISEGWVKWTIEFEKATLITPPPELYLPVVTTLTAMVDAYLLIN